MAITVQTIQDNHRNPKKDTGVTTGNEFIYKVDPAKTIKVTGVATSTGNATVFYSTDPTVTPTAFNAASGMVESSLGALTDNIGEEMSEGIEWVGVQVTSGTWTNYIKEV